MTRILFLPNDQTFLLLDSPFSPKRVIAAVKAGQWAPPEPYGLALAKLSARSGRRELLQAFQQNNLVVITAARPLELDEHADNAASPGQPDDLQLTRRQQEVLQCLAEGLTTKQIALRLGLRPRTIALHVAGLKRSLGTTTRAQSVGRAAALGLCRPGNFSRPHQKN